MSGRRRCRVVHVIGSLAIGGAETLLLSLVRKLTALGIDSEIVVLGSEASLKQRFLTADVPVHQIGMARGVFPTLAQVVVLLRLGRTLKPDLIHGWMAHGNLAGALMRLASFRSTHLLWSVHQALDHYGSQPRTTRFSIRALSLLSWMPRRIVYVSNTSRDQHRRMGFRDSRAIHIPNGVDPGVFRGGGERRAKARAALGVDASARVVGHVARYHPAKDPQTLLLALRSLLLGDGNAHAVVIGQGWSNDNAELESWLRDPRLSGRLSLLGPRSDVPDLLPAFDVFCLSSASEACPIAMLEAMSSELRCVVTDVGDAAWMLGGTGEVVPARDPLALAAALRRQLDMPADEAAVNTTRARDRVLTHFAVERMVERYRDAYQAAMAG